jgi:cytochrome oxidase Cu insertion factor (SCO1/SenC/PrrC family)
MRKAWQAIAVLMLVLCSTCLGGAAELKVGDKAPDFTLTDTNWKKVSLHDFQGKNNVVLAFYVLAFTGG